MPKLHNSQLEHTLEHSLEHSRAGDENERVKDPAADACPNNLLTTCLLLSAKVNEGSNARLENDHTITIEEGNSSKKTGCVPLPTSDELNRTIPSSISEPIPKRIQRQESRIQKGAAVSASRISLSDFHKAKYQFRWPSLNGCNDNLPNCCVVEPGGGIPFKVWRETIGTTQNASVNAFEVPIEYGFADTLAVKEICFEKNGNIKEIRNEINNLQDLRHNHVITFLGTYIRDDRFIGIVMFPVASYNLKTFIRMTTEHNMQYQRNPRDEEGEPIEEHEHCVHLRRYFACLCRSMIYLHDHMRIKHKDIKPENILVDSYDSVIITDFGISTRHTGASNAITSGPTGRTVQYAAPEAMDEERPRDFSIDIFSLGCVFLEMANVLYGETIDCLYEFLSKQPAANSGEESVTYYDCADEVRSWISKLKQKEGGWSLVSRQNAGSLQPTDNDIFDMILKMMSDEPKDRPSSTQAWALFDRATNPCHNCHPSFIGSTRASSRRRPQSIVSEIIPENNYSQPTTSSTSLARPSKTVTEIQPKQRTVDKNLAQHYISTHDFGDRPVASPIPDTAISDIGEVGMADITTNQVKRQRQSTPLNSREHLSVDYRPRTPNQAPKIGISSVASITASSSTESPKSNLDNESPFVSYQPSHTAPRVREISPPQNQSPLVKRLVRVFSLVRHPRIENKLEDEIEAMILVFKEEGKPIELIDWRKNHEDLSQGVLMRIPRRKGSNWRCVKGDLNLWKVLPLKYNMRRVFGNLRTIFFKGNWPDDQLLTISGGR
ncbi:hypothetical protein BP6252_09608 [Coleophoma cylindrospora]|uniref:Protein kinase domain-containing protein n=1 Tax=Coleophoma cylindrospora TaxID=1849047 RepID=A0A3D8QVV7_9HELO|nr:hypothetical protein BP6252_09608 [Coleophoma cylindrospora]